VVSFLMTVAADRGDSGDSHHLVSSSRGRDARLSDDGGEGRQRPANMRRDIGAHRASTNMKFHAKSFAVLAAISIVTTAAANQAHDRIFKLPESKRNEVLTEFMARSGDSCMVKKSFFQGFDDRNSAFWSVACSNNKAYSVMLNDDGSSMIFDCKVLKAKMKIDCFKTL
jgi:hypothetical protein